VSKRPKNIGNKHASKSSRIVSVGWRQQGLTTRRHEPDSPASVVSFVICHVIHVICSRGESVIPIPNRYHNIFKYRYPYRRRYYKYRKILYTDKNIPKIPNCRYFQPQYLNATLYTITHLIFILSQFTGHCFRLSQPIS